MNDMIDPKGLIRESYRIEGITDAECRSIMVDWALSLPDGADHKGALTALIDRYAPDAPDHPMTRLLHQGLAPAAGRGRRGRAR